MPAGAKALFEPQAQLARIAVGMQGAGQELQQVVNRDPAVPPAPARARPHPDTRVRIKE